MTGLTYTGEPQALVSAGSSTDGAMQYSIDEGDTWSDTVPSGTNAGNYKVFYRVVGDENHKDTGIGLEAKVVAAPSARELPYTGSAQALVTAGTAEDGEMRYALGDANGPAGDYSASIPAATAAGTYYVWYKVAGDEYHLDTQAAMISSHIVDTVFGDPDFVMTAALTSIEAEAFEGAAMTVVDARGVTAIGANAFKDCGGLTQIRLPKDCAIDETAFAGCGTISVFAPAGGTTQAFCQSPDDGCVFVAEAVD